jgi:hypothetical protein
MGMKVLLLIAAALVISSCGMQGSIKPLTPTDTAVTTPSTTPTTPTSTSGFVNGGNSFQGNSTLGNLDNYDLGLITNNLTRLTITNSGNVGVGTASPAGVLDVRGGTASAATNGTNINIYAQNAGAGNQNGGHILLYPGTGTGTGTTGSLGVGGVPPAWLGNNSIYADGGIFTGGGASIGGNVMVNGGSNSGFIWADSLTAIIKDSTGTIIRFQTNNTDRMRIDASGRVGIGIPNPTYQLQLSTDSAAKPGTSTWTVASDERLKDIHRPFNRGLKDLLGLHTIYFNYKKENSLNLPADKEFVGIKAQDVEKVIPEAVSVDDKGYLHVTNDSIIWTAVNAIKELYHKFLGHDQKLAEQERQIASLKARLDKIEKSLTSCVEAQTKRQPPPKQ